MKRPRETYPLAIVPEHLSKLTVEKLPLDHIYYIAPGESDDYKDPAIFESPSKSLLMSKSHAIDMADEFPASPIGSVGVMKTFLIDPDTKTVRDYYVADLRFVGDHDLIDTDNLAAELDQEEHMAWLSSIENTIMFSAFIAADQQAKTEENGRVHGAFYGNPKLYDALDKLDKRGNKLMKKFLQRQKASEKLAQAARMVKPIESSKTKQPVVKTEEKKDLSVQFIQP